MLWMAGTQEKLFAPSERHRGGSTLVMTTPSEARQVNTSNGDTCKQIRKVAQGIGEGPIGCQQVSSYTSGTT